MFRNEGYTMTEAEASIFLPCLVEKVMHILTVLVDAFLLQSVSKSVPIVPPVASN